MDMGCSGLTPLELRPASPVAIFRLYSLSIRISSSNSVQVNNFQKVPFLPFYQRILTKILHDRTAHKILPCVEKEKMVNNGILLTKLF
jgi:hypothetical protein